MSPADRIMETNWTQYFANFSIEWPNDWHYLPPDYNTGRCSALLPTAELGGVMGR